MSDRQTVVVAMSGGVDSSTTAALLVERGYRVIGLMMRLWSESGGGDDRFASNRCCSPEAVADARGVCQLLGIPFYLLNFEDEFKNRVVDFFLSGYAHGVTPNPCLQCNRRVKFGALLDRALALGADYLATGHYARVRDAGGTFQLLKGVDDRKDQSYALHVLDQTQLSRALFPLGEFTKSQTRETARRLGLRVAEKHESQDLCFVADGDYRNFVRRNAPPDAPALLAGDIVDTAGRVVGRHDGLVNYTVGQRKGLGAIAARHARDPQRVEPLFVLSLDVAHRALVVGTVAELGRRELTAAPVNWIAGGPLPGELRVSAKIRYRSAEVPATVYPVPDEGADAPTVHVVFDQPLRDITPGQAVVFYDREVCLGGGTIV